MSVGYQASDDDILRATRRRHAADFMAGAMALLRDMGFLVNLDLMACPTSPTRHGKRRWPMR